MRRVFDDERKDLDMNEPLANSLYFSTSLLKPRLNSRAVPVTCLRSSKSAFRRTE
jgi:hypothetical protein